MACKKSEESMGKINWIIRVQVEAYDFIPLLFMEALNASTNFSKEALGILIPDAFGWHNLHIRHINHSGHRSSIPEKRVETISWQIQEREKAITLNIRVQVSIPPSCIV